MWSPILTTCSNATEVGKLGAPSCSRPQPATDNGIRDGRSNFSSRVPPPTQGSTPWAPCIALCKYELQIARLPASSEVPNTRPSECLGMQSPYAARYIAVGCTCTYCIGFTIGCNYSKTVFRCSLFTPTNSFKML